MSFYVADQITAQRFLTTKTVSEAKRSFALNCVSVTLMVPALTLVGISLLNWFTNRLAHRIAKILKEE